MWGPPYANGYWGDARVNANKEILAGWEKEISQPRWMRSDMFSRFNYGVVGSCYLAAGVVELARIATAP
jgi:hypothetical protein